MKIKEFIQQIYNKEYDNNNLRQIEKKFGEVCNEEARALISQLRLDAPIFFDGEDFYRIVSLQEILDASADMNVDFETRKIFPLIDCSENDFISFDTKEQLWCKFNIVDEFQYSKKNSILEYFK